MADNHGPLFLACLSLAGTLMYLCLFFLNILQDKEIYGIIKKIKECKYFEKQEDETVREEKETEIEEEEPIEPVKSTAEEASIEPEGAFTSDVRGAEVYQEVPSDHQVPVSIMYCLQLYDPGQKCVLPL